MGTKKRKQGSGSKAKTQKRHARRRAMERFSIELTTQRLQGLLRQIHKGESVVIFRQSNRIVHHRVTIGEDTAIAVYDKNRGTIVTLLYEETDPRWATESGLGLLIEPDLEF